LCRGVTIAPADFVQLAWLTGRTELLRQLLVKGTAHVFGPTPAAQPTWGQLKTTYRT
jgi:hypothetical protein